MFTSFASRTDTIRGMTQLSLLGMFPALSSTHDLFSFLHSPGVQCALSCFHVLIIASPTMYKNHDVCTDQCDA